MKFMDPNYTNLSNGFTRVIRVSFQCWEYSHSILHTTHSNANIKDVLDFFIEEMYYDLRESGESFTLYHETEGELECSEEDSEGSDWLMDMVSGVEVLGCYKENPYELN